MCRESCVRGALDHAPCHADPFCRRRAIGDACLCCASAVTPTRSRRAARPQGTAAPGPATSRCIAACPPHTSLLGQRGTARACDRRPGLGCHQLRPAPIELPMVALTEAGVAGPGLEVLAVTLMAQPHLQIQRIAPGDDPAAGAGTLLPVVHVVLLEGARRAKGPYPRQPHGLLDLRRGCCIHINPGPELNLVGAPRVPDAERA